MCSVETVTLYIHLPLSISYACKAYLSIYNKDQSSTVTKQHFWIKSWIKKIDLSRKVPNLTKTEKRIISNMHVIKYSKYILINNTRPHIHVLNFMQCTCVYFRDLTFTKQFNLTWNWTNELFDISFR